MNVHVEKLFRALGGERRESLSVIFRKVASNAHAIGCAMTYLRPCDALGARARSFGRPHIDNQGSLVIGDDFAASCTFGTLLLATHKRGHLWIGDGVTVNYGSAITAASRVWLGDRVMVGPYCVIADTDAPLVDDQEPSPIEIGDDVWLAGRVTVRPGARIGAGAVIGAGSVVEGEIPPLAIASGAPARVLRIRRPSEAPPPPAREAGVTSLDEARARISGPRLRDASR
jgi:acetyltransferase-like isoleucine patch superfamily enzyme